MEAPKKLMESVWSHPPKKMLNLVDCFKTLNLQTNNFVPFCWKFLLLHHQLEKKRTSPVFFGGLNDPSSICQRSTSLVAPDMFLPGKAGGSGLRKMFQKTRGGLLDILWWQNSKSWNNLDTYPPWSYNIPWKWMVGRLVSFWVSAYFQVLC